ncbi:hypothetical protein [Streptomyces cyaneofuscatus]|uniref:hypothetical protein n=1 Tax=Streptomyces cyaneofuscatus TaxID=66883 RepID=UPI003665C659
MTMRAAPTTVGVRFMDRVLVSPVFQTTVRVSAADDRSSRQLRWRGGFCTGWVPAVMSERESETQGPSSRWRFDDAFCGVLVKAGL